MARKSSGVSEHSLVADVNLRDNLSSVHRTSQDLSPFRSTSTENQVMDYHGDQAPHIVSSDKLTTPKYHIKVSGPPIDTLLLASLPDIRPELELGHIPDKKNIPRSNSEVSLANFSKFTKDYILSPKKWYKPGKKRRKSSTNPKLERYQIEYSVFRPIRNLHHINDEEDIQTHLLEILKAEGYGTADGVQPDNFIREDEFQALVSAITHDVEFDSSLRPQRISQGTSGSYFIVGRRYATTDDDTSDLQCEFFKRGIFKPKDEEPYGPLSPKWTKWLHRTFFPCFFGRSCLIPNLGYISEAAACVLDQQLLSYIVPHTDVIYLKSNLFYYSLWERTKSKHRRYKIGSFQMFLNGYVEAHTFFRTYPVPQDIDRLPATREYFLDVGETVEDARFNFRWSRDVLFRFQEQLEKLVILDYIMRNTDRGADNWMIKLEWREVRSSHGRRQVEPNLKIGAIDSGLAFPGKHPDEWRSFPFGWLFLPYSIIGQPFSEKTRQHYLPLLTLKFWWEQTITKLKAVFSKDADFKERMWIKQVAVLKGQAFNVVEILKLNYAGPLELTRRENLLIWDDEMNVPVLVSNQTISHAMESSIYDLDPHLKKGTSKSTKHLPIPESTETTPLLTTGDDKRRSSVSGSIKSGNSFCEPLQMSGFEYNINVEDDDRYIFKGDEETSTKKVIIERLEKVHANLPVFTWC